VRVRRRESVEAGDAEATSKHMRMATTGAAREETSQRRDNVHVNKNGEGAPATARTATRRMAAAAAAAALGMSASR